MHPAVELLAKRMESNPDEFVQGHTRHYRWERIIEKYVPHMTDEDKAIIRSKYDALQLEHMHKEVMAELLYGDETKKPAPQMPLDLDNLELKHQMMIANLKPGSVYPIEVDEVRDSRLLTKIKKALL